MNFRIEPFDPKTTSNEIWDRHYTLYQRFFYELFPDEPVPSKKRMIKEISEPHSDYNHIRWIAYSEEKDSCIGWLSLYISKETSPAYDTNKHVLDIHIYVDEDHRRQGIGTNFLALVLKKARKINRSVIQGTADLESGKIFCKRFGGIKTLDNFESYLFMKDVDWEMVRQWYEEGPKRAEGVTLEVFQDVPEKDIEEYCKIFSETLNQAPQGETEGRHITTPETRRKNEQRLKERGAIWTTLISREKNGDISGLTEILFFDDTPTMLIQMLTGVRDKYRGRGVGKWLKAEMLRRIREMYPNVERIVTGNATTNAPMLSINNRLGFKTYRSATGYKFRVEELTKKIERKKPLSK